MQKYSVYTYTVSAEGRIVNKSTIACHDLAEAKAMADALDGQHNPGNQTFERRAIVCVIGYCETGKYCIPLHEFRYIKCEARADD